MSWTQGVQGLNEHKKVRQIKAFGDWYCFFNKNSFSRLLGVGETETYPRKELRACTRRRRRRWCWNISCPRTLSRWSSPTWVRKGSRLLVSASQSDSSILIFCHLVALTFSDCCYYSSESPKKANTGTTSVILILKVCTWFQIKVNKKGGEGEKSRKAPRAGPMADKLTSEFGTKVHKLKIGKEGGTSAPGSFNICWIRAYRTTWLILLSFYALVLVRKFLFVFQLFSFQQIGTGLWHRLLV